VLNKKTTMIKIVYMIPVLLLASY